MGRCRRKGVSVSDASLDWRYTVAIQFGDLVRERRMELGLTQAQLAHCIGTHRPLVTRMEKGRHMPSLNLALRYGAALGISIREVAECCDRAGVPPEVKERA